MMLIKYYIVLFIRHISTKLTYSAYQLSVFIYHIEQAFDFHTPGIYLSKSIIETLKQNNIFLVFL